MEISQEQAVLIHLDGVGLPDEVYEEYDLEAIEEQIEALLEEAGTGQYDGNEFGPETVTMFMYGPDAEALYRTIETAVTEYPLCSGATVIIRSGPPGAPERTFVLPS